jgi:hypothetical protein
VLGTKLKASILNDLYVFICWHFIYIERRLFRGKSVKVYDLGVSGLVQRG